VKVFVTGGTGYLGQRIAAGLAGAGHEVTALARSHERGAALEAVGARVVIGDVTEFGDVDVDLGAFDACIHSAALVKTKADPREFDRVNVGGVANVAKRCLEARVGRFVYTSSFMALGASADGRPLDETAARDGGHVHNDYERTKYLGLLEFQRWVERGLPGIALFPCVIYGPGALTAGNLTASAIADLIQGRLPGIIGDGRRIWTYSFVEDVVEGHILALSKGKPGERYILGGHDATLEEFVRKAGAIASARVPRLHIPYWVAKVAAFAEELAASVSRREPKITREVVEIYKHHWVFSSAKAIRDLGYRMTPFDDALTQTVLWVMTAIREGKI